MTFLQMLFSNLSANQEYLLKIQALTSSLYQENLVYPGVISEVRLQIIATDNVVVDIHAGVVTNCGYHLT